MSIQNPAIHSLLLGFLMTLAARGEEQRKLFTFTDSAQVRSWQIVNDGVMGGRSSSQASFAKTADGVGAMQFSGRLSLANNGGFASVRSRRSGSLGLRAGDEIVLRVLGDGRTYTFNLYTPDRRTAFSYQLDFETIAGKWVEVRLPVDRFVAHSFGRAIPSMRLSPSQVNSVGILLGDKKPGSFQLWVYSITVD